MAEIRTDPHLIDVNVATSLAFQKHMTDYIDMVEAFPDETVLSHIYAHMESHSDPISSKIEFYKQLNNKTVKIDESVTGKISPKVTEEQLYNKNIRDQLSNDVQLVTDDGAYGEPSVSGDKTKVKMTEYTKVWVPESDGVTHANSNGKWMVNQDEPEEQEVEVFDQTEMQKEPFQLESEFGMEDMSPRFILWWLEKFSTAHAVVKRDLIELLGEDNEYFVKFSESVGQLKNTGDTYDFTTTPLFDVNIAAFGDKSIPNTITGVAQYCTKPETLTLSNNLAIQTNSIYRKNMFSHADDASRDAVVSNKAELPTNSHGCNLVHDAEHPKRIMRFIDVIREELKTHLKGLYDVLELLSNRENFMTVGKPRQILMKVETFTQSVDLFKNKIKSYELSSDDITQPRFGKSTAYNNQYKNVNLLAIENITEEPGEEDQESS